jgi:hypothetical protein
MGNSTTNTTHSNEDAWKDEKKPVVPVKEVKNKVNEPQDMSLHFSIQEILLYASVISATDAVAALTFVNETEEPKLYSVLFGEGVVNDAVCIVLYGIIQEFTHSGKRKIFLINKKHSHSGQLYR